MTASFSFVISFGKTKLGSKTLIELVSAFGKFWPLGLVILFQHAEYTSSATPEDGLFYIRDSDVRKYNQVG